jgi:tRNA dimethylallyltransferase
VTVGSEKSPVIAIVGPTASGKSTAAIETALRLNGEIINCDSVQVYQEIKIATAKVPLEERKGVPHHLIDVIPPQVNYTAGDWARDATREIEAIENRGHIPLLVGGTGFYLRALRQPFFSSPETNHLLRQRINSIRKRRGPEYVHRLLKRLDPRAANEFFPRDWPRVQRALEVYLQTGQSIVDQKSERPEAPESALRLRILALNPPRTELYDRIDTRTEEHFKAGLVDEVRDLLARGIPADSNALGAHGYRRVVEFLRGERNLASAIAQTKLDIRHYAKRQMTWFRHEPGVEWIEGFGEEKAVMDSIIEKLEAGPTTK